MNTSSEKARLLVVEDDPALAQALALALSRRGFNVAQATNGVSALERASSESFSAIVLDLSLPELDGLEVLRGIRDRSIATPVIVLTARGTVGDRVQGLRLGADDYLSKPFDLDELEARLHALLRRGRSGAGTASVGGRIDFGALLIDEKAGVCYANGEAIELSAREYAMLSALLERPAHAVTRERLWEKVFADGRDAQPDAIEVVAYRLRKKIAGLGVELVALRGVGYLIREKRDA
ncbi:MAG: response regulator transcription factor [Burkholderiales bacterium]|nr:response regulator transcription factor [Burkholderiales bacterium]